MPARLLRQYAAIFFFAPLVQRRLGGHDFGLSEVDQANIRHSIRRGYITFAVGLAFLVVSTMQVFLSWQWLTRLYRGLMGATLLGIGIGIWQIHHPSGEASESHTSLMTNHMLTAFLPGYNWHLRYTEQDPQHPYRWLKESILWRYLIMLCLLIPRLGTIAMILIALMIIRLVVLAAGYDLIPTRTKQWLNRHYTVHIEERYAYISAGIAKLWDRTDYQTLVHDYRHYYRRQLPVSIRQWQVTDIISYVIHDLLIILLLWRGRQTWQTSVTAPSVWRGVALLIVYYVIRWRHGGLGPVPIIQPIVETIGEKVNKGNNKKAEE